MPAVTNFFFGRGKSHGSIYELTILGGDQTMEIYIYIYMVILMESPENNGALVGLVK